MTHIKNFLRPFAHAIAGLQYAVVQERNMRIHLVLGAYVLFFQRYYQLSTSEFVGLLLTIAMVLTAELVNTAVEKVVDLSTAVYHALAKIAKDVAAGAVLLCAVVSIAVGFCLFYKIEVLEQIAADYLSHGAKLFALLLSMAVAIWFVFCFGEKPKKIYSDLERNK